MPLKENEASKNKHTRQICPFAPSLENVILLAIPCNNSKPCLMNARQPVDYFNYSSDLSLSTAQSVPSNLCSIPQRNNNRQDGIRGLWCLCLPLSQAMLGQAQSHQPVLFYQDLHVFGKGLSLILTHGLKLWFCVCEVVCVMCAI